MSAAAAFAGLVAISIVAPAAALAPVDSGPLYSWRGLDTKPLKGAVTGVNADQGVVVERVERGSPAARAKLKPGDFITRLDGISVGSPRALAIAIADHCCGATVALSVWRDQHRYRIELPPH